MFLIRVIKISIMAKRIEEKTNYGKIIAAIAQGNKTLSAIAETVNRTKPGVKEQLDILLDEGYIQATHRGVVLGKNEELPGFSVKYILNKPNLMAYWEEKHKMKFETEFILHNFDRWIAAFVGITTVMQTAPTIDAIGVYFVINQNSKNKGIDNVMNMTFNDLVSMNLTSLNKRVLRRKR